MKKEVVCFVFVFLVSFGLCPLVHRFLGEDAAGIVCLVQILGVPLVVTSIVEAVPWFKKPEPHYYYSPADVAASSLMGLLSAMMMLGLAFFGWGIATMIFVF